MLRSSIPARAGLLLACLAAFGCTAVSISPPLTSKQQPPAPHRPGAIMLTSGTFAQPHQVMGVMQMTQTGYRWFYEVELVSDANPASILYKVAMYARDNGADGVQNLELVDLKPQSPAERTQKQISGVMRVADAAKSGQGLNQAASEGEETRWEVRGEFVRFAGTQGAPR